MAGEAYLIVWEFVVRPRRRAAFLQAYGPHGTWAQLFRRGRGYRGTELLRSGPGRYVTIDRWRTAADYRSFLRAHRRAYRALDAVCGRLTVAERLLAKGPAAARRRA